MAHLGMFCFPSPGHLNPMLALGRELTRRGHRVTLFQLPSMREAVERAGLEFQAVGGRPEDLAAARRFEEDLSASTGLTAVRRCVQWFEWEARLFFADAPAAVEKAGVDGLIIDQIEFHGLIVAKKLGLPHLIVSNALPLNTESGVPPCYTNWGYADTRVARARNVAGHVLFGLLAWPLQRMLLAQARAWGVDVFADLEALPHVTQVPACLDFPRRSLPVHFHYTGPFVEPELLSGVRFPWDWLDDDRPLIYASLGTTQNGSDRLYRLLVQASDGVKAQVVLSMGRRLTVESLGRLPSNVLAVPYVPQWDLLERADLVVTHGGVNTVLHTLLHGLPMVAVPIANDQPGVAARLAWTGAAHVVPAARASVGRLRSAITRVLETPDFARAARQLRAEITAADGLRTAAMLIEQYLAGRRAESAPTIERQRAHA